MYFVTNEQNLLTCLQLLYVNKKVSVICYIYLYTSEIFLWKRQAQEESLQDTNQCVQDKKLHQEALMLLTVKVTPEIRIRIHKKYLIRTRIESIVDPQPCFLYA